MKKATIVLALLFLHTIVSAQVAWSRLGTNSSMNQAINSIVQDGAGNIYAAGKFQNSSDAAYVAKYDGTTWTALGGTGLTSEKYTTISKIVCDQAGNVYAAINPFSGMQYNVCKWNGTSWNIIGTMTGPINTMVLDATGNLFVAGQFYSPNIGSQHILKWNGTNWSSEADLSFEYGEVHVLAADAHGNVYAAGNFYTSSTNISVQKWDGTSWTQIGSGFTDDVRALALDASGNIYAGGRFGNGSGSDDKTYVAKWNGVNWGSLGNLNGNGSIETIAVDSHSGNVFVAGGLRASDYLYYVSQWNGNTWAEVGTGNNRLQALAGINTLYLDASSRLYAGGAFYNPNYGSYVATTKVQLVTSITEKTDALVSSIYPNPNNGLFTIELKEDAKIIVSDALGRIVQHQSAYAGTQSIDIQTEPQGLYIISIQNKKGQMQTVKFLKDK